MARYDCTRCEAVLNTTMAPHLCRDVEKRLQEAERRAAVSCRQAGSMMGWLARMEAECGPARPPKRVTVPVWDKHHGRWDLTHSEPA